MPQLKQLKNIPDFEKLKQAILAERANIKKWVSTCGGTSCCAANAVKLKNALVEEIKKLGLQNEVGVRTTGCHGFCEHGPLVVISPEGICYQKVKPEQAKLIVTETIHRNNIIENLLYQNPNTKENIQLERNIPFYKKQRRIILNSNKLIDPTSIFDYIAEGGYNAVLKVLGGISPEDTIAEIKASGLRGRGGAGFPTGFKWEFCRKAKGDTRYIICNADEGDPGAYMDRSVLEGNPHSVLEGMIIGAYAIGSSEGVVYVRNEYPLAVKNVQTAIKQAREAGLLGKNILGTKFDFDIHVEKGAGAFVCGEETALIASIEGKMGEPRQRPPFPANKGLWGKPTNINNVETLANVPIIINKGAQWYSQIGTEKSKGTKIFSLVGKVKNTGLVEVPMGTTIKEIVYDIGGGILADREYKAVQTGGPSGGCIPKEHLELPVDYESLAKVGSIMGSGGMIVMDDGTCMVDVAKYFTNFLREESCGKCLSCREGTRRMWEMLANICEGRGKEGDIELLRKLAGVVKDSSMCGLGQTAGNPVLSTLRYFEDEYREHIKEHKCRAGVCKAMIEYEVIAKKCVGCLLCLKACPQKAISGELKKPHVINIAKCVKCGICFSVCKAGAVQTVQAKYNGEETSALKKNTKEGSREYAKCNN
ncbi:NADH-quinone oxidoreductase subunit NuoF [Elusimicrobiota bacterium]